MNNNLIQITKPFHKKYKKSKIRVYGFNKYQLTKISKQILNVVTLYKKQLEKMVTTKVKESLNIALIHTMTTSKLETCAMNENKNEIKTKLELIKEMHLPFFKGKTNEIYKKVTNNININKKIQNYMHVLLSIYVLFMLSKKVNSIKIKKTTLPHTRTVYTVLRSPHADKKSRQQFIKQVHNHLITISNDSNIYVLDMIYHLCSSYTSSIKYTYFI